MSGIIPFILLAAGASSRMRGRDKLLEEVDGTPLLLRQVRMLRQFDANPLIVTLPPAPTVRHDLLRGQNITCVDVADAHLGLSASLKAALTALPEDAPAALLMLGDLPAIAAEHVQTLLGAVDLSSNVQAWRGATEDGKPGHPLVVRNTLFPKIAQLQGDEGARALLADIAPAVALVPFPGQAARLDLDTPEDWAVWRAERQS